MFWIGFFSCFIFYAILLIIASIVARKKKAKNKQNENDYEYIVKNEIENNKKNDKSNG